MPKIYRNKQGVLVKESTLGCEECGFDIVNATKIEEPVVQAEASENQLELSVDAPVENKSATKKRGK
jgi:hypothetical protein